MWSRLIERKPRNVFYDRILAIFGFFEIVKSKVMNLHRWPATGNYIQQERQQAVYDQKVNLINNPIRDPS